MTEDYDAEAKRLLERLTWAPTEPDVDAVADALRAAYAAGAAARSLNTGEMVQWVVDSACDTGLDWRVWVRRQKSDVAIGVCLYVMCEPRFESTALGPLPVARIERAHEWGIEELEHVYDGPGYVLRQVRHIAAELARAARAGDGEAAE